MSEPASAVESGGDGDEVGGLLDEAEVERRDFGVWSRLEEQFGLVSLRPRLADDVRLRHIGEDWELVQISTRRVLPLTEADVPVLRGFDGERTVAEHIVASMGAGRLSVEPILSLVDQLVRAEMLAQYPPDLYRQVVNHLARLSVEGRELATVDIAERGQYQQEQVPWRPRSPILAERARFLRGVALLASLDLRAIGDLAEVAHEETWPAASDIVKEGARADRFYVVRSGEVNVTRLEDDGAKHRIARLGPGDWFGESGLLEGAPRNATVRAGTSRPVQLYSFDAGTFERLISPHVTSRRGNEFVSSRRAQLEQVPLFHALAPADLDRLARILHEVSAPKGTVLFHQGEPGDRFYVVVDGSVGVVKDGQPIAKLVAGEFFGETALLFTEERTATVATTEDSRFWVLERDAFTTFIRDALLHRRDLMPVVLNRIGSNEPV